jgi:RNA polymerase sigma-70 factor (ECF subfamily)
MKAQPINDQKQKELEVLRLLREGSKAAFEEIFRHYWKGMFSHAYSKLQSKEIAEEIVQEIFTTLWAKREETLITNLSYYLHTSVKNRVLNHIRLQIKTRKYWEYYKNSIPQSEPTTEETVLFNDLKESIDQSVYLLSDKAKKIFHLSRIEGYSVSEIASKLNISEKVVEYHVTTSLKKLKVQLRDYLPR